ncbi:1-(5-phosphoribosyl)-5-[(5-phosphoribosylamino)methylideneamino]imidazole-4-carboxamide isomerase [Sutcliffiella rhizosphaerae]|uniref:1-(5-phosphoribosyl)-5-[(5-phosphoribosylamino)methylideneamino] imidazole-4-carboxamide isomerase n=1 Tax=Sutcliffiella rhizosphaerae TaxID=2880967 RepID=A0ABN8A6J0_9BACI|nr:1-(5-phosphoribosyl)-5-[(5-phosphoribosylamino)methylideneamino]imidazole-4-carboxamide isomerase [Sutcliffiella rhizosphaerae]CAG9620705.1 1-(5-phosphoribosyl)-5-[(5-phosphoribosylamino)methylideneamino] imidazole-4-carboxamide isomerase [Sutcliffiella rhizosphaerae]
MSFTIYPAIDMRDGKCVRLLQGDYTKETVYGDSPYEMASQFVEQGAKWIHMVDLDGAKAGNPVNDRFVLQVARELNVRVQIGGGIRSAKDVEYYLSQGVDRVILGSAAIHQPSFVREMLSKYGSKIAIGLDAKDGYVATEGWMETSTVKATLLGKELADAGAKTFIFTDIATDGMLSGPNVEATVELARVTGVAVIASGGVSSTADLKKLRKFSAEGVAGSIVGKAIYTNKINLASALKEVY